MSITLPPSTTQNARAAALAERSVPFTVSTRATSFAERTLNNTFTKKKIILDIILVAALLIVALLAIMIVELTREDGAYVSITVQGDGEIQIPLSEDGEYTLNGGTNTLVIEDGKAYMKEASCPDGLCKHQGKISRSGQRITCLPNRVFVIVIAEGEDVLEN